MIYNNLYVEEIKTLWTWQLLRQSKVRLDYIPRKSQHLLRGFEDQYLPSFLDTS